MKIAVVTNDGRSISAHFGRARNYLVVTVENGTIVERELRDKTACDHGHHGHGHDHHAHDEHHESGHTQHHDTQEPGQSITMLLPGTPQPAAPPVDNHSHAAALISDCAAVLSRGMGRGMYANLQRAGVRPVLTTIVLVDEALTAFIAGSLEEHPELVH